jgi:DNA-binding CsgD family transcriptional regulator
LNQELVFEIEEAAVLSEKWPVVLHRLAGEVDAQAGLLFAASPFASLNGAYSPRYADMARDYFATDHKGYVNPRIAASLERRHAGFLADTEILPLDVLEQDYLAVRFQRPAGIGRTSGTILTTPSGDTLVFDIGRDLGRAAFTRTEMRRLDRYRPHLARAALLASRLGLERARAATDGMRLIGLPAAALSDNGRVLMANDLFAGLAPAVASRAFDRLALADRSTDQLLHDSLETIAPGAAPLPRSIPLRAAAEQPAMILHLVPIRRGAHDIFSAAALLVVTTVGKAPGPSGELLAGLFDLTPAEARLARALVEGRTLDAIAAEAGVSLGTVRGHLKQVLSKTATHRQAELVSLLSSAQTILRRDIDGAA